MTSTKMNPTTATMRSITLLLILSVCNHVCSGEIIDKREAGKLTGEQRNRGGGVARPRGLMHKGMGSSKSNKKSNSYYYSKGYSKPHPSYLHSHSDDNGGGDRSGSGDGPGDIGTGPSDDPDAVAECSSPVAQQIQAIPESITLNPGRCCSFVGPTMVLVTHALKDSSTATGFEPFWDAQYLEIAATSKMSDVCFVMSGYNPDTDSEKTLSEYLLEVNELVSKITTVPSMMSTDPSEELDLVNLFRQISDTPGGPNIGIFNAGLKNIETEALVTGRKKLPYVGYTDDTQYGSEAADITLRLLRANTTMTKPLCFNGRPELSYVGRRCAAYYTGVTAEPPNRLFGISCRTDSNVNAILALILETEANAIYSQIDCCQPVALAVERARQLVNHTIIAGCQDEDPSEGVFDFVTGQPMELQAYQTASWATLPVLESLEGQNGKGEEYFPSLTSMLETEIYTSLVF